jgi:hypothetical protein
MMWFVSWEEPTMNVRLRYLNTATSIALLPLLFFLAPDSVAEETLRLECAPQTFHAVPGEPIRLRLTVQADSAVALRWHVPDQPLLHLRAVERLPVRLAREGAVVYERVVVWQGLEPGAVNIKKLSVETDEQKWLFPEVTVTIRDPAP